MLVKVAKAQCALTGKVIMPEELSGGCVSAYPFLASDHCLGSRTHPLEAWYVYRSSNHACVEKLLLDDGTWYHCPGSLVYATLELE